MCQFKSFVINKQGKVFHLLDDNSHNNIKEHFKLHEGANHLKPNLVSCEIIPKDSDVFNQDLDNWKLVIDQDIVPDWLDNEQARELGIRVLKETWDKRFAFGYVEKFDDKNGIYYIAKNGEVNDNYGKVNYNYGKVNYNYGKGIVRCYSNGKVLKNRQQGIVIVGKKIYVADKDYKINRTKTENIGG